MRLSAERQGAQIATSFALFSGYLAGNSPFADNRPKSEPLLHISTSIHRGLCTSHLDKFLKCSFRGHGAPHQQGGSHQALIKLQEASSGDIPGEPGRVDNGSRAQLGPHDIVGENLRNPLGPIGDMIAID